MTDELPEIHRRSLDRTGRIVRAIRADQLGDPTPDDDWDVRTLLHHVVHGNLWVAPLVAGETIDEVGDRFEGDVLGTDFASAYHRSAIDAAQAFLAPGAMDAPCAVSYGPVPGSVYCGHRIIDVLVHGWDLAVATGGDTELPADLVQACLEIVEPQAAELGASGAFGRVVEVEPGAPPQTRLLALLGRRG